MRGKVRTAVAEDDEAVVGDVTAPFGVFGVDVVVVETGAYFGVGVGAVADVDEAGEEEDDSFSSYLITWALHSNH